MKRLISATILSIILLFLSATPSKALALDIEAAASILIDADSGRLLWEKNSHSRLPPASLTKILTALVTLEQFDDLTQTFTLPENFVNVGESGIGLEAGETHTIEDLLYALMLRSANDAGQALALAVAGSESAFAQMMDLRCVELGLTDSKWINPHGLHHEEHLSSAYDMAYITRAAMQLPMFNTLICASSHSIPWVGNEESIEVVSHNRLLQLYKGADGVKTGYTSKAGNCLVGSATRNGLRLIGVVLNSEDTYGQMARLLDYGFENYELRQVVAFGDVAARLPVINGRANSINAIFGSNVRILMPKEENKLPQPELKLPEFLITPINSQIPLGEAVFDDGLGNSHHVELFPSGNMESFTLREMIRQAFMQIIQVLLH
ncbi:MAG: D-alanyl-D-alanine carboxypeptidase [Firmicutes bacterium]|nr:D-alanyl-D-alanine carboxypeptidase [Bacillota bacterium]